MKPRMTILELNEFNRELLKSAAKELGLKSLQKIMSQREVTTTTEDTYESNFLEPWVQWVSVHTGTPSRRHQIKHLGDVPHLDTPQIWERLSMMGVTCGVWGAMNASRGSAENCLFFLPDPWTFSEPGYPGSLKKLLELPRYVSKNYVNLSYTKTLRLLFQFLGVILSSWRTTWTLLSQLPWLVWNSIRFRAQHFVFICFTDRVLTELYLEYRDRYRPEFSILFLNSVAHMQHHHWRGPSCVGNPVLSTCLKSVDRTLGRVLQALDQDEILVFMNGLSQMNTNTEAPWILYRQKDQASFLRSVGIAFNKVEPHMTYDAHIFFRSEEECQKATSILEGARIQGEPLFLVETYLDQPKKLFYRIDFSKTADQSTQFEINGLTLRFLDLFEKIVERTGRHIQKGTIYTNFGDLPPQLANHELFSRIVHCFADSAPSAEGQGGPRLRSENEALR